MGARHSGREAALQMFFQMEASGASAEDTIRLFWKNFEAEPEGKAYADQLVLEAAPRMAEVDETITKASEHWRLERMTRLDRNLLRLGTVELAKSFGTDESSAFVNGVLNRIADDLGRRDQDR